GLGVRQKLVDNGSDPSLRSGFQKKPDLPHSSTPANKSVSVSTLRGRELLARQNTSVFPRLRTVSSKKPKSGACEVCALKAAIFVSISCGSSVITVVVGASATGWRPGMVKSAVA